MAESGPRIETFVMLSQLLAQVGMGFDLPDVCSVIGIVIVSLPFVGLTALGQ